MQRFILSRIVAMVVTLWVLSLAIFLSVRATGDAATFLLGSDVGNEAYEQLRRNLGLDRPLIVQYLDYVGDAARGDFGNSIITGQPVRDVLLQRFPATLQLAAAGFAIAVLGGLPLGIVSALRPSSIIDRLGRLIALVGIAAPTFWLGIMLILLFGVVLGWLPTYGQGGLEHLVLPAVVLGLGAMAGIMRLTRSSMLEVLDSEYVKFARIKGLSEQQVVFKHALKNALMPVLTFAGITLAGLLNGSVVIEVVFAWPGIGRLMLDGINTRDFPIVQATVLVAGFFYLVTSLLVDLLYAYVNPRIRL